MTGTGFVHRGIETGMNNGKFLVKDLKRTALVFLGACIMAMNMNSFVQTGGLIPGGFNGLTLLIQQIGKEFFYFEIPFTAINLLLNSIPIWISFRFIGKKFTIYSCIMIILTSVFTDILPAYPITHDTLLVSIFGGIMNALAISLCLFASATSGGTDFIAIFLSERFGIDAWNYILLGNMGVLLIAGALFGWNEALYSIIFQFTSTQVLTILYKRYQKKTLLIVTNEPDKIYEAIKNITNHDATLIKGIGCYQKKECNIIYSIVSSDETRKVLSKVREIDSQAFTNIIKTEQVNGHFYQRPND